MVFRLPGSKALPGEAIAAVIQAQTVPSQSPLAQTPLVQPFSMLPMATMETKSHPRTSVNPAAYLDPKDAVVFLMPLMAR